IAVGIPALQKIRVCETGVGCHAKVEHTPAGLRPGERDKACVEMTTSVESNTCGEAAQRTLRVEVIGRVGRHRMFACSPKTMCPGTPCHPSATRSRCAIHVPSSRRVVAGARQQCQSQTGIVVLLRTVFIEEMLRDLPAPVDGHPCNNAMCFTSASERYLSGILT